MNQQDIIAVKAMWRGLLLSWEKVDGDDPVCWRKKCGAFDFYITKYPDKTFTFSAHRGDDVVIIDDSKLQGETAEEAMKEGDTLISEIIEIGVSILKTDEIRIKQAFTSLEPRSPNDVSTIYHSIMGVGEDGKLYYFNGREWEPRSMKINIES